MSAMDGTCDICRYSTIEGGKPTNTIVGVASIPGFPMSVAWCGDCLYRGATPLYCVEATLCDDNLTLYETVQRHGLHSVRMHAADWFLEACIYVPPEPVRISGGPREGHWQVCEGPGRYVKLDDYLKELAR